MGVGLELDMGWVAVAAFSVLAVALSPAAAKASDRATMEPPVYPEIILETDDSYAADAELTAFRRALIEASESLVETGQGKQLDPESLTPFLSAEVEFLVAQGEDVSREEFVSLGLHPARRVLEMAGRMSRASDSNDARALERHGMRALADLAAEPTVGRTSWLGGRICTASYGRISWPNWVKLDDKLGRMKRSAWRIAAAIARDSAEGLPSGEWPKRFQMVPVSYEQKRSAGWIGIIAPEGDVVFFRSFLGGETSSYFAPYLNSHLCFEKRGGDWKVSAVAMRLD